MSIKTYNLYILVFQFFVSMLYMIPTWRMSKGAICNIDEDASAIPSTSPRLLLQGPKHHRTFIVFVDTESRILLLPFWSSPGCCSRRELAPHPEGHLDTATYHDSFLLLLWLLFETCKSNFCSISCSCYFPVSNGFEKHWSCLICLY